MLIAKQLKGVDPKGLISEHLHDILVVALKCLAVFQNFRLQNKPDPDNITESKKAVSRVFEQLQQLS